MNSGNAPYCRELDVKTFVSPHVTVPAVLIRAAFNLFGPLNDV